GLELASAQMIDRGVVRDLEDPHENLNWGLYVPMAFKTLMNVSCARSSARARSRTMRYNSEKMGRSKRRTSSRNAASWPCLAHATTSGSLAPVRLPGLSFAPMKSPSTRPGQVSERRWRWWRMVEVGGGGASQPPPTFTTSPTSTDLPLAARAAKRSYV